jgi:uncharacterized protein (TIGR01777 family)
MKKKIVVTGATGLIGKSLVKKLIERNDSVVVLSKKTLQVKQLFGNSVEIIEWDYGFDDRLVKALAGVDAVIHLAGANIASKRWNESYKKTIIDSRTVPTRNLIKAMQQSNNIPSVFVCASAVGFYGNTGEKSIAENSPAGNDFLSQVCAVWEEESSKVEQLGIRRVSVRTGIVLSTQDGALKKLLLPFKLFAGGPLGNGKQWFPWIHIDDEVDIFLHAIDNNDLTGAANAVSPEHLRMKEFASILGGILNRPSFFNVPPLVLKIVLGEAAESILFSQKIKPEKLLNTGFKFKFSSPTEALSDLIKNKK